jgi:hypothetical protein
MVIVILTLVQRDFWTSYPKSHLMRCFTRFARTALLRFLASDFGG